MNLMIMRTCSLVVFYLRNDTDEDTDNQWWESENHLRSDSESVEKRSDAMEGKQRQGFSKLLNVIGNRDLWHIHGRCALRKRNKV